MEKFVKTWRLTSLLLMVFLTGCASVQMPGYIGRTDHAYHWKFQAGYEKIVSAFVYVLKKQGWSISEADPSTYERDDRYDNGTFQNLLIITDVKKHDRVLYSTYMHLNILIHSAADSSDVEVRYEAQTPSMVKQIGSLRNDQLANSIYDAVVQEITQ